jgi:hypothetical protein
MPDPEVYDVFARLNTYTEKLKPQELRNAKWFGDFKSSAYTMAKQLVTFFGTQKIFSPQQILRMAEAEFISELLLASQEGIREKKDSVIDNAYRDYDDRFPNRNRHEKRLKTTVDVIGNIFEGQLPILVFRATRLFYPLFCAVYHMQYKLPKLTAPRRVIKPRDYAKIKSKLEEVDVLIQGVEASEKAQTEFSLSAEQKQFFEAYRVHWVHAPNRVILTQFLCRRLAGK